MPPHPSGSGWALAYLLQSSPFLRACALQVLRSTPPPLLPAPLAAGLSAHPSPLRAEPMAAALALALPEPRPSQRDMLAAGWALQALVQQPLPACEPRAVFLKPYSPDIAALPPPALLALLQACQLCAFPEPLTTTLTACVAQRYASLPPAVFEAEVGTPCQPWAGRVREWWWAHFGHPPDPLNGPPTPPLCFCAWVVASGSSDNMPRLGFGLLPEACASVQECWARGMACTSPAPSCAAFLAMSMGQHNWTRACQPKASAAGELIRRALDLASASANFTALLGLLEQRGAGCALLAHPCCMLLWEDAAHCPGERVGQAVAALAGVLRAHPGDGCIAQCACAAVRRLVGGCLAGSLVGILTGVLSAIVAVLCHPSLPLAATCQAALCLSKILDLHNHTPTFTLGLARRLVSVLQWDSYPELHVCAATVLWLMTKADGTAPAVLDVINCREVLQPLVRMLDLPLAQARQSAVRLAGQMASHLPGAGTALLDCGVLPPLLRALHPYAGAVYVRSASYALYHLLTSRTSEATARAALPRLAELLSCEERGTLQYAVATLRSLCSVGGSLQQAVLEAGCLPRLVTLLGTSYNFYASSVLTVFASLAFADSLRLQAVLNAGALPCMAALLLRRGRPRARGLHEAAAKLLQIVCREGTHSQLQAALESWCLQGLARAAGKGSPELAQGAGTALAWAAERGSQLLVQQLAGMGGVAPLCTLLARCTVDGEGDTGVRVLKGLGAMLRKGVPAELLVEAGAGEAARRLAESSSGDLLVVARKVWEELGRGQ